MKAIIPLFILISSTVAWSAVCDLTAQDNRVASINRQFDEGYMRGEDHLVQLTLAQRDRLWTIENCLISDMTQGLSKADLLATKEEILSKLSITLEDFRVQIEYQISMDRMGMATQLMMERDLEKLRISNLVARIDLLIQRLE